MTRYFHLYADGKRIREISWDEYLAMVRSNQVSLYKKRLMWVEKDYIGISKGEDYIVISLRQLLEVLRVCGVIKDEG